MKRTQFIRNLSIIGAGLVLTPWKLTAGKATIQQFTLPPASVHIPHGNFASEKVEQLLIMEMNLTISTQVFMKNGIKPSSADLKVITIQRNHEIMNLSFTDRLITDSGRIGGVEVRQNQGMITLIENGSQLRIDSSNGLVKVVLRG